MVGSLAEVPQLRLIAEDGVDLMLESATLDRTVHAAFLRRVGLPPPAPGPAVFAWLDRSSAWDTADAGKALVVWSRSMSSSGTSS